MGPSSKLLTEAPEQLVDVLIGRDVVSGPVPEKANFSDRIELMELVEPLCPVLPARDVDEGDVYKL